MSKPLSVSVCLAVKNAGRTIHRCIQSVRAQTFSPVELVIVDNFSTDGTAEACQRLADKFFQQGPERSAQRNRAIRESTSEYVLVLDADQYLSPEVVAECVRLMGRPDVHGVVIPEETIASGFWGRCKKFERDFYLIGDPSAEAARFFRRDEVLAVGGFNEAWAGGEDWDLSDRILARYGGFRRTRARIFHDEGHIYLRDLIASKRYYAHLGVSDYLKIAPPYRRLPFPLRPSVRKQWRRLVAHPLLTAGTMYMKFREGLPVLMAKKGGSAAAH